MSPPVTRRPSKHDVRKQHKALFASACALLHVDYGDVAAVCDEDLSTVKSWGGTTTDRTVPDWAMRRIRAQLPNLAAVIDAGMDAFDRSGPHGRTIDVDAEAPGTAQSMALGVAALLGAIPDGVDEDEAKRVLPLLIEAHERIARMLPQMEALAGVVRLDVVAANESTKAAGGGR